MVRSVEADSTRVARETTLGDVASRLGIEEEPVTTEDGIGSERWSLKQKLQHTPGGPACGINVEP